MIIVMLGAPGSGKGTQAKLLSDFFSIKAISTGQMLREAISDRANPLSDKLSSIINSGRLISDDLMNEILADRLKAEDLSKGVILDGYPRNILQAQYLENIIDDVKVVVIYLNVEKEVLINRLSGRFACAVCQKQYHETYTPTSKKGVCDECGATEFERRKDDAEEAVLKRLEIYAEETSPIIRYYKSQSCLLEFDGDRSISEIFSDIRLALSSDSSLGESLITRKAHH